ncbi:hypothetical protein GLOIN_2v1871734 [Rhizophagus clarus]|uniref:Uncharacterized protein n=1 Tax=Rhizophagus clarus TaxID=94130 RepID=A0A8H3L549_9GLOM|nr:hypothetical protein GLOIN_2v1871734 [Rhizophagus clarus]
MAEREQYQNLLNDENRRVRELRHQLNEARAQALRTDQMMTDALRDERNAQREYWEIAENRKDRISELLREKFAFCLLIQRKETQIAEHRRNAYRLTMRYNNDIETTSDYTSQPGMATNNNAGKQRVLAFFESYLTGKAADWYEQN